jgi:hypothetical protein
MDPLDRGLGDHPGDGSGDKIAGWSPTGGHREQDRSAGERRGGWKPGTMSG